MVDLPRWLADALAWLAVKGTQLDPTLDGESLDDSQMELVSEREAIELEAWLKEDQAGLAEIEDRIPDDAWEDSAVQRALSEAEAKFPEQSLNRGLRLWALVRLAASYGAAAARAVSWLFKVATARERTIAKLLSRTYANEIDLHVAHLMDMGSAYLDGSTDYDPWPRQVQRMQRLAAANGRILNFVGWDPLRREGDGEYEGLTIVKQAIAAGCGGVKVYPPSGYRPSRNEENPDGKPPRHFELEISAEELNRRHLDVFLWCADKGLPVFTHCTPHGFEAYEGAGRNSHPKYWRCLLESDPGLAKLRLCLGHAGGDGWIADQIDDFVTGVIDLCTDESFNVYCEFGILSEITDERKRRLFVDRLKGVIRERPMFAQRMMYGTDWHMLYMHANHGDFLTDFRTAFEDAELKPHAADFFRNNAVRYLGLAEAMQDR